MNNMRCWKQKKIVKSGLTVNLLVEPQDSRCGQCVFIVALTWVIGDLDQMSNADIMIMYCCMVIKVGK